jgi:hypothetical protein
VSEHVLYKVQRQSDGSYVVLEIDRHTGKKRISSHHDTYEEAQQELEDGQRIPSQEEVLKFFNDLRNANIYKQ